MFAKLPKYGMENIGNLAGILLFFAVNLSIIFSKA